MTPAYVKLPIALLASLTLCGLTGCKTAGELLKIDSTASTEQEMPEKTAKAAEGGYRDPGVVVLSDDARIAGSDVAIANDDSRAAGSADSSFERASNVAASASEDLVMEPTRVSAYQASIFSTAPPPVAEEEAIGRETTASLIPAGVPQHGYNAASASLFSARRPQPPAAPLEPENADSGL